MHQQRAPSIISGSRVSVYSQVRSEHVTSIHPSIQWLCGDVPSLRRAPPGRPGLWQRSATAVAPRSSPQWFLGLQRIPFIWVSYIWFFEYSQGIESPCLPQQSTLIWQMVPGTVSPFPYFWQSGHSSQWVNDKRHLGKPVYPKNEWISRKFPKGGGVISDLKNFIAIFFALETAFLSWICGKNCNEIFRKRGLSFIDINSKTIVN